MSATDDLGADGALELSAAVRSGAVSPVELVRASLTVAEGSAGALGAFTVLLHEEALERARQIEQDVRRGLDVGVLGGVPITIKDSIWMRDAPATNGSLAYRDFVPAEDSASVRRLREAGAVIIAKTNVPEFCFFGYTDGPLWGPARNPWDAELTAGGSSGGAAASVAAGVTTIALGTDGGGSIRGPASFCGTFGLKPTFDLIPTSPSFEVWPSLSVHGPITRSPIDAAVSLAALTGSGADSMYLAGVREPERTVRGWRVAWSSDLGYASVDPDVRANFEAAIVLLSSGGLDLVEAHPETEDPTGLWTDIAVREGYAALGHLLPQWEPSMWPGVAEIIRAGDRDPSTAAEARERRRLYRLSWDAFFAVYDLLLTPMMQVPPFPLGVSGPDEIDGHPVDPFFDDWSNLCYPANLTGQPAGSVPIGFTPGRLPVGMQVMAARGRDDKVLTFSAAWAQMQPWPAVAETAPKQRLDESAPRYARRPPQHQPQAGTHSGARLAACGEVQSDGRRSQG